jgi:endonuclease YncB( thermonuclease family)
MRTKRRLALPLVVFSGLALAAAPSADAARGPCVSGQSQPKCNIRQGKVTRVVDGDTVKAKIKKGKSFAKPKSVSLVGVQAMELAVTSPRANRRGDCHALEATERLEALVLGRKVRLSARNPNSGRVLLRAIAFKKGGNWQDVGSILAAQGHALWDPHASEWAWNKTYARLSQFAANAGDGIFDTDACGAGPAPGAALRLKVKWDAEGVDGQNVNGEFIRVTNTGATPVPLGGWWARDSAIRRFTFPAGTVVPANGSIVLRIGQGANQGGSFFWRQGGPVFENVVAGSKGIGDGGYLFDPQGDLRAWQVYPCSVGCTEPLNGKVTIDAQPQTPESITITNTSAGPVDLAEYEVESSPYFYEFARGTVLPPGGSIQIATRGNPASDTQFSKGWGLSQDVLANGRDVVTLRNPLGAPVVCDAWGGETCPQI